jgi:hypothetical protein
MGPVESFKRNGENCLFVPTEWWKLSKIGGNSESFHGVSGTHYQVSGKNDPGQTKLMKNINIVSMTQL